MMMNNQQIGTEDQGSRSLGSFPFKMPNSEGFSSQQPAILAIEGGSTGQNLRTAVHSDITCNHFESGTECYLNFPRFEQHDDGIPSWSQASEMGSSAYSNHAPLGVADPAEKNYVTSQSIRDTLQSLVQSSFRSSRNTRSYQENFGDQISNVPQEKHIEFQQNQPTVNNVRDWRQYFNISFQKNVQLPAKWPKKTESDGLRSFTSNSLNV